jgi:hypothetical protein
MATHHDPRPNQYYSSGAAAYTNPNLPTWTSRVSDATSSTTVAGTTTVTGSAYQITSPYPNASGTPNVFVTTPQQPQDGMIAIINGKVCRYNGLANMWQEIGTTSPTETVEVPTLPIELDTSGMLAALRQYRDFLDDLDGLDQRYADAVSDTLFGLNEAIEALETIE